MIQSLYDSPWRLAGGDGLNFSTYLRSNSSILRVSPLPWRFGDDPGAGLLRWDGALAYGEKAGRGARPLAGHRWGPRVFGAGFGFGACAGFGFGAGAGAGRCSHGGGCVLCDRRVCRPIRVSRRGPPSSHHDAAGDTAGEPRLSMHASLSTGSPSHPGIGGDR